MKTEKPLLLENWEHTTTNGVLVGVCEWWVSLGGSNPPAEMCVRCADRAEAEKLMRLFVMLMTAGHPGAGIVSAARAGIAREAQP